MVSSSPWFLEVRAGYIAAHEATGTERKILSPLKRGMGNSPGRPRRRSTTLW